MLGEGVLIFDVLLVWLWVEFELVDGDCEVLVVWLGELVEVGLVEWL